MERGIQLPTLIDHHICHGVGPLGGHVKNVSFSSSGMNCLSMDSIIEVFYHLNIIEVFYHRNEMSIATKYIADNNFVF